MTERRSERARVETFGCRLNITESEIIRRHLDEAGADDRTVVINTCAVTSEAERQARQAIRKLRRERPEAEIVVTGCAAQIHPQAFADMPEVDRVVGNIEKLDPATWAQTDGETPVAVADIMTVRETAPHLVSGFDGHARGFVQIQTGCDHRCTFCIIPYGRGNSRSVPMGGVVAQVRELVARGYNEIVLTGVDLTSYGGDLPGRPSLGQLCRRLLALVPDLPRLRLSSLDPVEIDDELMRLVADEPRLMPHIHLSLQAGDDLILKRMKRRHLRDDVFDVVERLRRARPDLGLGCDVIAGFPTETDAMFENTRALIADLAIPFVHVFPYSEREGTPAARMPQLPKATRKARAAILRDLGQANLAQFLAQRVGGLDRIVVERGGVGHGESFVPIRIDGEAEIGALVTVRLTGVSDGHLIGRPEHREAA
jgi:threonylcarbamoyladenosine tRNA methylthiotransferase MtaB